MRDVLRKSRRAGGNALFQKNNVVFLVLVILLMCCAQAVALVAPAKTALACGHTFTCKRRPGIANETKMNGGSVCAAAAAASGKGIEETEATTDNIQCLRQRFDFPEDWANKDTVKSRKLRETNPSKLKKRLKWMKNRLDLTEDELGVMVRRDFANFASLSMSQNVEPTLEFLSKELSLNKKQLTKLVTRQPSILGLGIHEHQALQRRIQWFHDRFGQDDDGNFLKDIVQKSPTLLTFNVENNSAPTVDKLQERLHLEDKDMIKLVRRSPVLLKYNYTRNTEPKLNWLQESFRWNDQELRKVAIKCPGMLYYSLGTWKAKMKWLKDELEWSDAEVSRAVRKQPRLLSMSLDSMEAKLIWLQQQLDWDRGGLGRKLCAQPFILALKLEILEERMLWLMERLESDHSTASMIIKKCPILLGFTTEALELRLQWFEQELAFEKVEKLAQFVRRLPSLLTLSIPGNLEPTLQFYKDSIGDDNAAIDFVKKTPSTLSVSLAKRLKRRHSQARKAGIDTTSLTNVRKIANCTEEKWIRFLEEFEMSE